MVSGLFLVAEAGPATTMERTMEHETATSKAATAKQTHALRLCTLFVGLVFKTAPLSPWGRRISDYPVFPV